MTNPTVSNDALMKLCAALLMVAAGLAVVGHLAVHPPGHQLIYQQEARWVWAHALSMWSFLFASVGCLGLYVHYLEKLGLTGLIATALTFVGLVFHAMSMEYDAYAVPAIEAANNLGLTGPGGAAYGAPFLRAGSLMRGVIELGGFSAFGLVIAMLGVSVPAGILVLLGTALLAFQILGLGGPGVLAAVGLVIIQGAMGWLGWCMWRQTSQAQVFKSARTE